MDAVCLDWADGTCPDLKSEEEAVGNRVNQRSHLRIWNYIYCMGGSILKQIPLSESVPVAKDCSQVGQNGIRKMQTGAHIHKELETTCS